MTDNAEHPASPTSVSPEQAARLMRGVTALATGMAVLMVAIKFAAWWMSGSVALLSSLIDSGLDFAASLITMLAVRKSLVPPDADHRFGHGKAEPLAALAQSVFVGISAVLLSIEAVSRVITPEPVQHETTGIAVMLVCIVLTLGLVAAQKRVVRLTGSVAVSADSLHYSGDLMINLGVIVALLASSQIGWTWADPLCALIVAGVLVYSIVRITAHALDNLMDRELPDADRERILALAARDPRVIDAHDLRTRRSGLQTFILLHLTLPRDMTLGSAHDICEAVAASIRQAYPGSEVTIHQDPGGLIEERLDDRIR
ncbi:cation diffusion facilitator family transporter [Haematospirillum jordaniae]|uniref:cation diffusion facilitator family transporter n=1 Tax=Haematospirillum jordaniae TaxID=1549855 RepID=UPI0014331479|nr:cation diffusion facilitator family transporter [Haematospirillum jordaniae]NKD85268.1 cation diffusion facilitator family transporter [Haematospirillum jordaniae]